MKTLAQAIPVRFRAGIYSVLATAVGLEAIFDVVPNDWEVKIFPALVVLGFGVALGNTKVQNV